MSYDTGYEHERNELPRLGVWLWTLGCCFVWWSGMMVIVNNC